jgi:hypothetical protein
MEQNPFEKGLHAKDIGEFAQDCILAYFKDKDWFCGGPIPQRELTAETSIKTVLRTRFDDRCFNFIHEECLPTIPNLTDWSQVGVSWEVHCLLELLEDMRACWIPKEFQPGMVLLYFKFCKGVKILPPPLL